MDQDLLNWTEYENYTYFKTRLLPKLHSGRFLEYQNGEATLLPPGIKEAENIISKIPHN
jgi:hypothetical protein